MKTLILVDVQVDFLPGGALEVPNGDAIIPVLNGLQERFDLVVATQDWHPAGHASFASQHKGKKSFDVITWKGQSQTLWPDHCVQGTPGAEISKELNTKKVEAIFRKGMDPAIDSYSGFYDNNHEKSTALADYLRGKGINEVYIGGLAADVCVYFTVLDSLKEGFKTTLVEDATMAISPDQFATAKKDLLKKGGQIMMAGDVPSY